MKFKIDLEKFVKILEKNEKIITKSITFPILSYVLIEATKKVLNIYSTDFEINFKTTTEDFELIKEGKVCVAGKELLSFIKGLDEKSITLEESDSNLLLKGKNFEIKLKTINSEDYPVFPKIESNRNIEINLRSFKKMLRETYQSATIIETRPEISGFLIKGEGQNLKMVATDSFRLAESSALEVNSDKEEFESILSYKVGRQLYNLIEDGDGKMNIAIGSNQIEFKFSSATLNSRLIEGKFPDYTKIIPKDFHTKVIINREEFLGSLKRVSIFSTKINDVKLKISPLDTLTLISKNPDLGESFYKINGKLEGDALEISFNYKYLIEGINQIDSEKIVLNFVNKEKALLIQPLEDSSYLYLAMPIREV